MKSINRYLSTILFSSAVLLGLTTVSASASSNPNQTNVNANGQTPRVTAVNKPQQKIASQTKVNRVNRPRPNYYNRKQRGSHRIYQTHYRFTKRPGKTRGRYASGFYDQPVKYTRVARNQRGTFVKTRSGWLNRNAFNQFLISHGRIHYRMRVIHNGNLYNLPAHTNNARKIASTRQLRLFHQWVNVNAVADTNLTDGYYRFGYLGQNYWIPGQDLMFDLNALRGHNHRLERIISKGERLIDHSKYNEKTRYYDCSSFLHHLYAEAGRYIGTSTYSQIDSGRGVSPKHMKRGDLVFFNTRYSTDAYNHKISGLDSHVAMYLGHGLILQDSPDDDNGGVDVSSLRDPMWNSRSKYPEVHKLNGIVRRIF